MRLLPTWTFFLMLFHALNLAFAAAPPALEFDRIEGGTVYFKTPSTAPAPAQSPAPQASPAPAQPVATKVLKTKLHDIKYLGLLRSEDGGTPYALLAGKPCEDCSQDRAIYLIQVETGKTSHFVYPGRITDPKHGAVFEGRAFFGRCLARNRNEVYVVFQKEKVDRRRFLQPSVFVAEPGKDMVQEKLIERRLPSVRDALFYVKRKQCHEIEGRNRAILKKPLDLTPRHGNNDDDDDQDDTPKENQTDQDMPATTD